MKDTETGWGAALKAVKQVHTTLDYVEYLIRFKPWNDPLDLFAELFKNREK